MNLCLDCTEKDGCDWYKKHGNATICEAHKPQVVKESTTPLKAGGESDDHSLVCVDLFSGLGGFSQAMVDRGWSVFRTDIEPKFPTDLCADIRDVKPVDLPQKPDLLTSSPPCTCFSVASIGRHWKDKVPDRETLDNIGLVFYTKLLIEQLKPRFWVLENPRGMLRNVLGLPDYPTFFASWGDVAYKPTDLWGKLPDMEWPEPKDWEKAPRGARTGSQGKKNAAERAKIPYGLSEAIAVAVEEAVKEK